MSYEVVGITVLWTFLFGYLIVASIDFGAGFFSYYSSITETRHVIHAIINRYLSPVWEVTNVFLVFFFVGFIGFFPDTAYYYGTALLIPGSIAIVLLAVRGAYYAFNHYGSRSRKIYTLMYGASGLLIPAALSTVLTISEGGYIQVGEDGKVVFLAKELFTSSYSWAVVLLALVSVLYISAMFLSFYAHKAGDIPAFQVVRKYALAWSLPTIISSLLVFFAIHNHNREHFNNMLDRSWMFALSFVFFLIAVYFVWKKKRLGLSFICVILQFAFAFYGYGSAHLPYILYPYLTIHDNFTSPSMAIALIVAFILGLLLLIPSLYLLMKLFLFNTPYIKGNTK
ncbi:cytochrome d ubiquinol oxidase subunit II [Paenibacillus radicis (ex Gao et al. 2016)]|uniref:Cytochrome D ubiquinol oxidase subunit II n=1 Tax=Paenibacillus radicis (ex Gao et al. 2016) TaxID=1737354 RepID=A0A917LVU1_9BACL|nr:cytochrome d ubiquinol oxidase subunit II [Paenibacillus radicis (ex Gao et al. 2016)]GGG60277.1 cytochrome D ubiquinol oxidase subunit II [Paenibacillus radicis (ex Gao et al. 2016)]